MRIEDSETYKKEFTRMMDSMRDDHKGEFSCNGIECRLCPLNEACDKRAVGAFDTVATVERWATLHTPKTRREIFEDITGKPIPERLYWEFKQYLDKEYTV